MNRQELLEIIRDLTALPGAPGREHAVTAYMAEAFSRYTPQVEVDAIGNVTAAFGAGGRKIMVCAHTDEIGFFVKHISDKGFIYFDANGVIDERVLLDTKVEVITGDKAVRPGVIGVKSRHLMTAEELAKPVNIADLWLDVGADTKDEAAALGIRVGDPIVYRRHFELLAGGKFAAKAIDDRAGCAVLIALAQQLASQPIDYTVYLTATTQEEIGSRGAKVAAARLSPDIALVLDTVPAADPHTPPQQATAFLGGGPVIRTADFMPQHMIGAVYSAKLVQQLRRAAAAAGIACQEDVCRTWTDAAALTAAGIPCGGVYLPRRCSHAPVEVADINDISRAVELVAAFLLRTKPEDIAEMATFL